MLLILAAVITSSSSAAAVAAAASGIIDFAMPGIYCPHLNQYVYCLFCDCGHAEIIVYDNIH